MAGTQGARWAQLEEALDANQIDPTDFELQAIRAIEAARPGPAAVEPAMTLPAEEATLLEQGGLDLAAMRRGEPDMLLRTATFLAVIEAKSAPVKEVAKGLSVSRARVRQRAVERTLYAVRVDDEWRFPLWQFDDAGNPLPGLGGVVPAFPRDLHPVSVQRFMSEPSPDLEILDEPVSPIEWLRSGGDPEPIAAVAREL